MESQICHYYCWHSLATQALHSCSGFLQNMIKVKQHPTSREMNTIVTSQSTSIIPLKLSVMGDFTCIMEPANYLLNFLVSLSFSTHISIGKNKEKQVSYYLLRPMKGNQKWRNTFCGFLKILLALLSTSSTKQDSIMNSIMTSCAQQWFLTETLRGKK